MLADVELIGRLIHCEVRAACRGVVDSVEDGSILDASDESGFPMGARILNRASGVCATPDDHGAHHALSDREPASTFPNTCVNRSAVHHGHTLWLSDKTGSCIAHRSAFVVLVAFSGYTQDIGHCLEFVSVRSDRGFCRASVPTIHEGRLSSVIRHYSSDIEPRQPFSSDHMHRHLAT